VLAGPLRNAWMQGGPVVALAVDSRTTVLLFFRRMINNANNHECVLGVMLSSLTLCDCYGCHSCLYNNVQHDVLHGTKRTAYKVSLTRGGQNRKLRNNCSRFVRLRRVQFISLFIFGLALCFVCASFWEKGWVGGKMLWRRKVSSSLELKYANCLHTDCTVRLLVVVVLVPKLFISDARNSSKYKHSHACFLSHTSGVRNAAVLVFFPGDSRVKQGTRWA